MPLILPEKRVWKDWKVNFAFKERYWIGQPVASIIDGKDPVYPTSMVWHTLGDIILFLIDRWNIEWIFLDHACGNWILWTIAASYDLFKSNKISFVIFNDICEEALKHTKWESLKNIHDAHKLIFTLWNELENSIPTKWINSSVSNMYQTHGAWWSDWQIEQDRRLFMIWARYSQALAKFTSYGDPETEKKFRDLYKIVWVWEWDCIDRHAWGVPARVRYLLWERANSWQ